MERRLFDSHCHIIDHRFPIVANQGYTPPATRLMMALGDRSSVPGQWSHLSVGY
jgi:hypothetical protein